MEETSFDIDGIVRFNIRCENSLNPKQGSHKTITKKIEDTEVKIELTIGSKEFSEHINKSPISTLNSQIIEDFYPYCWCSIYALGASHSFNWFGGFWRNSQEYLPTKLRLGIEREILNEHLNIFSNSEKIAGNYSSNKDGIDFNGKIGSFLLHIHLKLRAINRITIESRFFGKVAYDFKTRVLKHFHSEDNTQFDAKYSHLLPQLLPIFEYMFKLRDEFQQKEKATKQLRKQEKSKAHKVTKSVSNPIKSPCERLSFFIKKKRGEPYYFVVLKEKNGKSITKSKKITSSNLKKIPYSWIVESAKDITIGKEVSIGHLTSDRINQYVQYKKDSKGAELKTTPNTPAEPLKSACGKLTFSIRNKGGVLRYFLLYKPNNKICKERALKLTKDNITSLPLEWIQDCIVELLMDISVVQEWSPDAIRKYVNYKLEQYNFEPSY